MERNTGTQFMIYLADKGRPGLEEGWIRFWQHKDKRSPNAKSVPFDRLDEIPEEIRAELAARGIEWPRLRGGRATPNR